MTRNELLEVARKIEEICDDLGEKEGRGNLDWPSLRFAWALDSRMERIVEWASGFRSPAYGAHIAERFRLVVNSASDDEDTEERDEYGGVVEPSPAWECREHGRKLVLALRTQAEDLPEGIVDSAASTISLGADERIIISKLRGRRIKVIDLSIQIDRDRKTVSAKLKKLRDAGIVKWPDASRGGASLTPFGEQMAVDSAYFPH